MGIATNSNRERMWVFVISLKVNLTSYLVVGQGNFFKSMSNFDFTQLTSALVWIES